MFKRSIITEEIPANSKFDVTPKTACHKIPPRSLETSRRPRKYYDQFEWFYSFDVGCRILIVFKFALLVD